MTPLRSCPDPASLQSLLQGALPAEEQARLTGHLDTCVSCQRTLEALAGGSQAPPVVADQPAAGSAYHRAIAGLKQQAAEPATVAGPETSGAGGLDFLSPPEEPGRLGRLGPYEVTEEIGRGGMGVVLKAYDAPLERWVAIKVLAPHLAADETSRKRFLREARAAAAVIHEHVVTIHAVGEVNAMPYLVMEYVAGISLQERLERGTPPDLGEILRIGMETAAGLAVAHARGLIHRDIKPANILLEAGSGKVKITDFGLARAVTDAAGTAGAGVAGPTWEAGLSQPGAIAGTPHYMAPEQARAQPADHRADLFSLGCVLYALCTGQVPFRGETLNAILRQVCEETPRPVREYRPEIPGWLAAIIDKLLAKDPADRYPSAAEVAGEFRKHLTILQLQTVTPKNVSRAFGQEYRSRRAFRGVPLVHIATGVDPHTGRWRVARGIIAIGNLAVGVVAFGAGATGGVAIGGVAAGLIGFGGLSLGLLLGVGGLALGGVAWGGLAVGGVAVGGVALGYYAFGGYVGGIHALGGNMQDPEAVSFFRPWLGWLFGR